VEALIGSSGAKVVPSFVLLSNPAQPPPPPPSLPLTREDRRLRCETYSNTVLAQPRWGGPVLGPTVRYVNSALIGILFSIVLGQLNSFRGHRLDTLLKLVLDRPNGKPLLTVSNHQSVMDDPGLWAKILPWWRLRPEQLRWQICTEDVFFGSKHLQPIIGAGNCMPLDRTGGLFQPVFKRFFDKLEGGAWCHIFPEGRVFQNWRFDPHSQRLGPFKVGVGKLIAHCPPGKEPIVLPMYHTGMDSVVPEVVLANGGKGKRKGVRPSKPVSLVPQTGREIRYFVGEPLDFTAKIEAFRRQHPGKLDSWNDVSEEALELYAEITAEIRLAVGMLELEAWGELGGAQRKSL
jgi:monolysocardiolipin acyltransferase